MRVILEDKTILWAKGSHYGRVFANNGWEIDVFSFAWEKDKASELDFIGALQRWFAEE